MVVVTSTGCRVGWVWHICALKTLMGTDIQHKYWHICVLGPFFARLANTPTYSRKSCLMCGKTTAILAGHDWWIKTKQMTVFFCKMAQQWHCNISVTLAVFGQIVGTTHFFVHLAIFARGTCMYCNTCIVLTSSLPGLLYCNMPGFLVKSMKIWRHTSSYWHREIQQAWRCTLLYWQWRS